MFNNFLIVLKLIIFIYINWDKNQANAIFNNIEIS